jgi:hypothetical protein
MSDLFEGCKPQFRIWAFWTFLHLSMKEPLSPFPRNIALYLRIWPHWLIDMAM